MSEPEVILIEVTEESQVATVEVNVGLKGDAGFIGSDGLSAYEIAVDEGFVGDETAWLASLVGPQGPSVFSFEGTWNSGTAYVVNDVINHLGSGYTCIQNSTNNTPASSPTFWQLIASKGDTGAAGTNGSNGAAGADGQGVPTGGTAGQTLSKVDGTDYNTSWTDPPVSTGTANKFARFDSAGDLSDISQWNIADDGYLQLTVDAEPNAQTGNFLVQNNTVNIYPLQNSPDESWQFSYVQINIDPNSDGFDFGTSGTSTKILTTNIVHQGTSDIGSIEFFQNNFNIGNGTDPIDVNGMSYCFGFGQFNANVNISGPIQGYGFQPNFNAASTIDDSVYTQAFYDAAVFACPTPGYNTFNSSPNIAEITNNHNFNGLNINPTIPLFSGNAGFVGVGIYGSYGTFNQNGYWQGINVSPTITSGRSVTGLNVSMDSVTLYAGQVGSATIQDITVASDLPSSQANNFSIEYIGGGTAGAEVASQLGNTFRVQIESGVSTATQVAAALNGFAGFTANFNVTISGTAGDAQVTQAAVPLTGGEDPGNKKAAYLDGDVEITGSLTFGGALSIGLLNAFGSQAVVSGSGNPGTLHSLVSNPTVGDNETITLGDTIGVNTAMLLTIGDNSTVTSGLVGLSALALPAVVTMGVGSVVDQVAGATFAISLDGAAGGGTITNLDLCRAVALPNGITLIDRMAGYKFDLPFGDPGTLTWGFYESPGKHNYFAGDLLIGGSAGSDDVVTNTSVAFEVKSTTKAVVDSRMTSVQRDALTAINGMRIYNTTTDKFQGYAAGAWADLH